MGIKYITYPFSLTVPVGADAVMQQIIPANPRRASLIVQTKSLAPAVCYINFDDGNAVGAKGIGLDVLNTLILRSIDNSAIGTQIGYFNPFVPPSNPVTIIGGLAAGTVIVGIVVEGIDVP